MDPALPWVQLLWSKYYTNGKVPDTVRKGGFWWRSMTKLLTTYKGAHDKVVSGDTIMFCCDIWNGKILHHSYPQLY